MIRRMVFSFVVKSAKSYVVRKVSARRFSDKSRKGSGELGPLGLRLSLEIPPSRPPLLGRRGGCAR